MKAREYAERWIAEGKTAESLFEILLSFREEGCLIAQQRNIASARAEEAIIIELDNKWRALARSFPREIDPELFRMFFSMEMLRRGFSLNTTKDTHKKLWPNKKFPQAEIVDCLNHMAYLQTVSLN